MWIKIFELPNGDIENVDLCWDKQSCYESCFADEYGLDEDGYVADNDDSYGRFRIIEINDDKVNAMLMFLLNSYIVEHDTKYCDSLICEKPIEEWLNYLGVI